MQVLSLLHDVAKVYGHDIDASKHLHSPINVSWKKPEEGWVVLNVDGSAVTNPGRTGYGGLVRNKDGEFLVGFYGSAGISHIGHVEMLALLQGIRLCRDMGFSAVQCYSDSTNTIRMVKEGVPPTHQEANEVATIQQMLSLDWQVVLQHTLREGNQCADFLAKLGSSSNDPMVILHDAPPGMDQLLLADAMGVAFPRG